MLCVRYPLLIQIHAGRLQVGECSESVIIIYYSDVHSLAGAVPHTLESCLLERKIMNQMTKMAVNCR